MIPEWWQTGAQHQLRSHDGKVTWATIERIAPYYRVRLLRGPCSQLKKAGSLRVAKQIATDWFTQRTT